MTVPLPDLFKRVTLAPGGVRINTLIGGNETGTPVLLLHGYPQTHVMWHHVAPVLAEDHMVVLTDLRGYGDSGKPAGGPTHEAYAKRTMAYDQVLVMRELGFESFAVAGHDRGARVAHRMALDYPRSVTQARRPGHRPHQARPAHRRQGLRPRLLALVLPRPAGAPPRAPDRRRPGRLGARPDRAPGGAAASPSTPRRSTSTSAASPTRPRSTPPARTTGPPSAPTWTTMTPRRPAARRSSPRCSPCGASTASSAATTATSRRSGASTRTTVQGRSLPVRPLPRRGRPRGDHRRPAGFPQQLTSG